MPGPRRNPLQASAPGLEQVRHILAVSSCKGGVGKSTVACNLAFTLAGRGLAVGLFDADVYGPSLPTLVHLDQPELFQRNEMIQPLAYEGVKLMSFGYVPRQPGSDAAIMRGPMVTQIINQLLTGTEWGELDFLVIDMPPGTGDIALTLTQIIPITGALIVTTPQQLSFIDVVKGIQMFDKMKVPTIGVVENMSYFQPEPGGTKYYLFGQGARRKLVEQYGFENTFELPVLPEISEWSDRGRPVVLAQNDGPVAAAFKVIGENVVSEIARLEAGAIQKHQLSYEAGRGFLLTMPDGNVFELEPAKLRLACRCAACVQEFSGKPLVRAEDIPPDIQPTAIATMGNYAVSVQWNQPPHASIYPYAALEELTKDLQPVVNVQAKFTV